MNDYLAILFFYLAAGVLVASIFMLVEGVFGREFVDGTFVFFILIAWPVLLLIFPAFLFFGIGLKINSLFPKSKYDRKKEPETKAVPEAGGSNFTYTKQSKKTKKSR